VSAFVVSKATIDVIVAAMVRLGLIEFDQADQTGQMLWNENYASVNYRYSDDSAAPPYVFPPMSIPKAHEDPALVLKQVHCLNYQSCEHKEWESSRAKALLVELECSLARVLAQKLGYDKHPWGI